MPRTPTRGLYGVGTDIFRLRDRLIEIDYTTDSVLERIGDAGQVGLHRNCALSADVALAGAGDPLATLIRTSSLRQQMPSGVAEYASGGCLLDVVAQGIAAVGGGSVRAVVELRPYVPPDDGVSGWLVSDLTPGLDGIVEPTRLDYVLGVPPASLTLVEITMRGHIGRALDFGTGCGVQSYHLSHHADRVIAIDLNPRTLRLARLGAALSGMDVDFREGSLYKPVTGERFDLIVSSLPYVMSLPGGQRPTYRESTFTADGLVEVAARDASAHLILGGSLQLLTNWAVTQEPWEERFASWVSGPGCDLFTIERERFDRFAYTEMWLTDAGLMGRPEWESTYRGWLAYSDRLGVDEVGTDWILLTSSGRETPGIRCESWPHAAAQPVGDVLAAHARAVDAARLGTADLLVLAPHLTGMAAETTGQPGAVDPEHLVLRQRTGLLRGMRLSIVTGVVLGALDSDLTVGQTMAAVVQLLEAPVGEVAAEATPVVRRAPAEQYLIAR